MQTALDNQKVRVQQPRLALLDVLRFFAIAFVLLRHFPGTWLWAWRFGWSGVDLFFVLSGFLVAGLLFDERKKRGRADVVRFLVRRAFKIYPSFWALVAATAVFLAIEGPWPRPVQWACELLFLQNYGPSVWSHTWSLAVEEHFYLALAFAFARWQRRASPAPVDRGALLRTASAALVAILAARCLTVLLVPARYKLVYMGTHVRIDGLLFGSLLAALYHTEGAWLRDVVRKNRLLLLGAPALFALPAFALGLDHPYTRSLGFTFIYLFYGAILLTTLFAEGDAGRLRPLVKALAYVGRYSYGIYLWHPLANELTSKLLGQAQAAWPFAARLALYFAASIAPGVALSRLIEEPFLALRDRLFPRRA